MCAPVSENKIREDARLRRVVEELEEKKNIKALQRSHVSWLRDGNRSTQYFMAVANVRRKANRVKELRSRINELIEKVEPWVTVNMRSILDAEFTREEVKTGLDHIGDLKAPGPDGMPSLVYKRHWHFMGDKVVIANRLKMILPAIISENQSAFVPGRLITDNVLVAYELSHCLLNKKKGKQGVATVKADMSKAYDRVEWNFVRVMLTKMGFSNNWVQLIMKCITSVHYQIKVNGELTRQFCPS
ncbi:uncharacterized protein [Aegilops tauschii subsp. strangulata]|uniref:uncharacterized protein n=1 Tax=Aegilops tauschii subsp. strangulata TaxID=200361 RepID=UPI003CC84A17